MAVASETTSDLPIVVGALTKGGKRPKNFQLWINAAYLQFSIGSWTKAAKMVGRSRQTLVKWRSSPEWPEAEEIARAMWRKDLETHARKSVLEQLKEGDGDLGFKVLERIDKELSPPSKQPEQGQTLIMVQTNVSFEK